MRSHPVTGPAVRIIAVVLLLLGAILLFGAVFADQLALSGIGGKSGDGLGWSQLIAAIVGLILLLVGASWLWLPPLGRDRDEPIE